MGDPGTPKWESSLLDTWLSSPMNSGILQRAEKSEFEVTLGSTGYSRLTKPSNAVRNQATMMILYVIIAALMVGMVCVRKIWAPSLWEEWGVCTFSLNSSWAAEIQKFCLQNLVILKKMNFNVEDPNFQNSKNSVLKWKKWILTLEIGRNSSHHSVKYTMHILSS